MRWLVVKNGYQKTSSLWPLITTYASQHSCWNQQNETILDPIEWPKYIWGRGRAPSIIRAHTFDLEKVLSFFCGGGEPFLSQRPRCCHWSPCLKWHGATKLPNSYQSIAIVEAGAHPGPHAHTLPAHKKLSEKAHHKRGGICLWGNGMKLIYDHPIRASSSLIIIFVLSASLWPLPSDEWSTYNKTRENLKGTKSEWRPGIAS